MGSRSRTRSLAYWLLPKELRDQPPETLGDAIALGHHIWIRCAGCSHSAVILSAVLIQLVGYDCKLTKLARRMKCQQCGERGVRVRAVEPGEAEEPLKSYLGSIGCSLLASQQHPRCSPTQACEYNPSEALLKVSFIGERWGHPVSPGIGG
jgi:hypothetical protein